MVKFKNKKTKEIWEAFDKEHIKYFKSNPNFEEVKSEDIKLEKTEVSSENTSKRRKKKVEVK